MPKLDLTFYKKLQKQTQPFSLQVKLEGSLFISLARAIAGQQLSTKAAATIYGRFSDLFPQSTPTADLVLKMDTEKMRAAGLSEAKSKAIKDLAEKTLKGIVPTDEMAIKMSDEELITRLSSIRGVGVWTVQMILMFRYRREDIWPVDDLGVQKGFQLLFPKMKFTKARELLALADSFNGKRSHLAWYCWRALDAKAENTIREMSFKHVAHPMKLWLQNDKIIQLDLLPKKAITPEVLWPGEFKRLTQGQATWLKHVEHALKKGTPWELLSIKGTDFQQQVWQEIAAIPYGEVRTYLEIGKKMGTPKAVRAIAQACGANPVPLLIPCHRVVGTGNLGGFAGGVELKRKLLKNEGHTY